MEPLLSIEALNIHFKPAGNATAVVKSNSFLINKGELVAVVGESGSGKSVTALSILQLLMLQLSIFQLRLRRKRNRKNQKDQKILC